MRIFPFEFSCEYLDDCNYIVRVMQQDVIVKVYRASLVSVDSYDIPES